MPDLRLTRDHFVGKCLLWANQPGQLSLPSPQFGKYTFYGGGRPSYSRPGLRIAVWLQVKVRGRGLGLCRLYAIRPLKLTQKRHSSFSMWHYIQ